jgi:hypothetical protein
MQFLQYSLQKNPNDRLSADELLELDFIQNAYNGFGKDSKHGKSSDYNGQDYAMPLRGEEWELSIVGHKKLF